MLDTIHLVIALITCLLGAATIIRPAAMSKFTGLVINSARGQVEMRAGIGALFLALGAAPLVFGSPYVYQTLGLCYLAIGVARFPSMLIYQSYESSNWISLAMEIVFGVLLIIPIYPVI